jgi:hypothetical protein
MEFPEDTSELFKNRVGVRKRRPKSYTARLPERNDPRSEPGVHVWCKIDLAPAPANNIASVLDEVRSEIRMEAQLG